MRHYRRFISVLRFGVIALGLLASWPASAQWTRVAVVPESDVFTVRAKGDTLLAGTRTVVFVSVDAGATWQPSARLGTGASPVLSVLMRNGRLYAGTTSEGVFISDNLGQSWQAFNQGLVGGFLNSQLDVSDLAVRGDSLYAATLGAGVYVRNLAGPASWSHFGEEFEPEQASNVAALAVGGTRLLALAGGNGSVFFREPAAAEWTISWLNNVGLHPGFQARSAVWTGTGWVVGADASHGVFTSVQGQEPWNFVNLNLGTLIHSAFATSSNHLFAAFSILNNSVIEQSGDDGATWDLMEVLPNAFVYQMVSSGADLFAGRVDGLWRRSSASASVSPGDAPAGLRFALVGPQPVANVARFRFELSRADVTSLDVFDVTGRRVAESVRQSMSAGAHEVSLDAKDLGPGIYEARLTAGGRQEAVRFVRLR